MAYYILSEDGAQEFKVTRAECLARSEEPENPFPQRWYVDEESGLVVRLPRNQMGEDLARDNMRSIWREQKYQERKFQCVWKGTNKCDQKCETCKSRTSRTVELDKPLGNDSDGSDTFYEPADPTDITEFLEQKAVLDTLYAALATLTQKDRELITDRIILEKTVRELAPKYDFKSSRSITVHVRRILDILRNEKYIGDALLQKTYTVDFLTKKRVKNNGIVPQYYVEGSHEAIIPREVFMQVQEELVRRRIVHTSPNGKTRTFSSNHCFAQIVICGNCGEVFRRVHWNNRGKKSIVWRCVSRLENTGLFCDARTVLESTIEQVLVTAINQALCDKDSFLSTLQDNIATVINRENDKGLADIDKRLEELQTELLKLATSNADYEKVSDEIHHLRDRKQKLQVENVNRDELKKRIADMSTFLKRQSTTLTEYDEQLVRRLIEKVTIYEDKFTVEFKSCVTVDVNEQR